MLILMSSGWQRRHTGTYVTRGRSSVLWCPENREPGRLRVQNMYLNILHRCRSASSQIWWRSWIRYCDKYTLCFRNKGPYFDHTLKFIYKKCSSFFLCDIHWSIIIPLFNLARHVKSVHKLNRSAESLLERIRHIHESLDHCLL